MAVAIGADRLEGEHVIEFDLAGQRNALRLHLIIVADPGACVIDIVGRLKGSKTGISHQARAVAGIGIIHRLIGRQPEKDAIGRRELHRDAPGDHILVIMLGPRGEIFRHSRRADNKRRRHRSTVYRSAEC